MESSFHRQESSETGRNVFINSLSCERRELDTQKIVNYLQENNYTIVHDKKKADYIIFMTCGATQTIVKDSFDLLEKYKECDAKIIVAGCLPDTHTDQLKEFFSGTTLSTKNLDKIDEIFPASSVKFHEIADTNTRWKNLDVRTVSGLIKIIHESFPRIERIDTFFLHTICKKILGKNFLRTFPFNRLIPESGNFYISISRGCIHNCTYCVIRKGVGRLQSKKPEQCVHEIEQGIRQGYRKFVLEADDIGPYGTDIGSSLPDLLTKMLQINDRFTVKISHTHPSWVIKYGPQLSEIFTHKKINNFFISIQSGNDRILKLMARPYPTHQLIETMATFKKSNPALEIGVDLIVGFPSETEEEFFDTLRLFDAIHFDYGMLFPFSCHEGTKASTIEPKISKREMNRRMNIALRFLKKNDYFAWRFNSGAISFYTR